MMPGLTVRVHDAYVAGESILHAMLLGLVSMVEMCGTHEVARGELMRFFGSSLLPHGAFAEPGCALESGRTVNKTVVPTPRVCRWKNYKRRNGMLIPLEGEVAWLLPEGAKPYRRGRITRIECEFAR